MFQPPDSTPRRARARVNRTLVALSGCAVVLSALATTSASGQAATVTTTKKKTVTKAATKPATVKRTTTVPKTGATPIATTPTMPTSSPTKAASSTPTKAVSSAAGKKNCVTKVMPLGDSLTAFPDSYRGPLFRQLGALGYKVDFVGSLYWDPTGGGDPDGEGHGGFTIGPDDKVDNNGKPANLSENIDTWIPAAKPDVILLTIGTNDMSGGPAVASAAPAKLKALVEHIAKTYPTIKLVIGDIPPNIYNVKAPADTKAVNDTARALGNASTTDNLFYGDTYSNLMKLGFDPTTGLSDGTHFTAPAGELFAKAWLPALQPVLDARTC